MANLGHFQPNAPIDGFRLETGSVTPGLAVIRGTAADQAKTAGAAAARVLGVVDLDQAPAVGDVMSVRLACPGDIVYGQAGASITAPTAAADSLLTTNASGQWVNATTGQKALAKVLTLPTGGVAAGDLFPLIFLDGDLSAP